MRNGYNIFSSAYTERTGNIIQPKRKAELYMKYMTVHEYEKNLILEDLARTKQALYNAYDHFENEVDPDLIDCYIYEVNAVQQRYKYLLKMAKQLQITPKIPEF